MFNDDEKIVIGQIQEIENEQRSTMTIINNILRSIEDLSLEGEEERPDLKAANDKMKELIYNRSVLMNSIGITAKSPLPDNIEKHLLA